MRPADHRHRLRAAALAAAVLAPTIAADAAVYRCDVADAAPRFSQFPCPNGGTLVALDPLDTVAIPPLSDAERHRLEELERERRAGRDASARERARAAREAAERRDERRAACEAARAAQSVLERKRRKGYTAAEERALDREEAAIDAQLRRHC